MSKQEKIISMFDDISQKYDKASAISSLGLSNYWKNHSSKMLVNYFKDDNKTIKIADIACGTGSMIKKIQMYLSKRNIINYEIIGVDPSSGMLNIAKTRFPQIEFLHNEVINLPFKDNSLDAICISYGFRNFINKQEALKEISRVLKNNGVVMVLDFFYTDSNSLISKLKNFYIENILPRIGGYIANHRNSFEYLSSSIKESTSIKEFKIMTKNHNLEIIEIKNFCFNVSHCIILKKKALSGTKKMSQEPFYRALKTVTMKCFVKYFDYFYDLTLSPKEIIKKIQNNDGYTKESINSRISNARFIVKNKYSKQALLCIKDANRADEQTKKKAQELLKQYKF